MADVRELLARLNPTTIRLDIGSGGQGGLSNQDIAAALAFVPAGLGREALIACWWPDGSREASRKVLDWALHLVSIELREQSRKRTDARLELGIAEACAGWHGRVTDEQRRELERARNAYDRIRESCWPRDVGDVLPAMVRSILDEIRQPALCQKCAGRGEVKSAALVVTCSGCSGSGKVATSDRARAERIGRNHEAYRRHWAPVYAYLYRSIADAEQEAAGWLRDKLRAAA